MTAVDWVVLSVVLLSCLAGLVRGFVREAMALAGWVVAFLAARLLAPDLAPMLTVSDSTALRYGAAIVLIFVVVLFFFALGAALLSRLVKWAGLGTYDRILGLIFGGLRAGLILLLLTLLGGLTALPRTEAWRNSLSHAWLEAVAMKVKPWLPSELAALIHYQ